MRFSQFIEVFGSPSVVDDRPGQASSLGDPELSSDFGQGFLDSIVEDTPMSLCQV